MGFCRKIQDRSEFISFFHYKLKLHIQYNNNKYMDCCFAAINTKGFETSLDSGVLPEPDHVTYEGAFNELKFSIGPKAKKPMELHVGFSRSQYAQSAFDNNINNFLAIFTKGSKDGEDRDERHLNSVIVLDISGSMSGGLGGNDWNTKRSSSRLQLAKQAIRMFYSKLRPTDSFGLVVFDDKADTIFECNLKSEVNQKALFKVIDQINTRGGTTLMSGFKAGEATLKKFMSKKIMDGLCENRIVMLTDVGDNSMENAYQFVRDVENAGISTTIVGISSDFKSSTCQKMNEVAGFNYLCATEIGDLKKYLFENFSYTFFPSNYNIQIGLESQQVQFLQVFGTVDAKKVPEYNAGAFGVKGTGKMIITRSKTSFPSELETSQKGEVLTYGSLIVIKLKMKEQSDTFKGKITLSYQDYKKQKHNEEYPVNFQCPKNEQFFSDQSLQQGMSAFHYVYEVKQILEQANSKGNLSQQNKDKYCQSLKKLQPLAPKSKVEELNKLINVLKGGYGYSQLQYGLEM